MCSLELLLNVLKLIPKLLSVFEIFTDPLKLIKDFVYGIKTGFSMLFEALLGNMVHKLIGVFKDTDEDKKKGKHVSKIHL